MSKYGHRTGNWLEAIVNKIGGEEAADAFLCDEIVIKIERVWKTWKTIKIGTIGNVDEMRKALKTGKYFISDRAEEVLGKSDFKVSDIEQCVDLVKVSVEKLGFKKLTRYEDICKRAFELGLDLCPAEVGPQLRLQHKDNLKEVAIVAMNAITDFEDNPRIFRVLCDKLDEKQCLCASRGDVGSYWDTHINFLFLRRKNTQS
jgi:hypothetical protein